VLGIFTVWGIWKGFFREVLGFVGILAGIFVAIIGFGTLSRFLHRSIPDVPSTIWVFVSFIALFASVYILSRLLAGFLSKFSSMIFLGWLNRLLGGVIGFLKGAVFISLFLLLLGFFPFQDVLNKARGKSLLYEPLQRVLPVIYNVCNDFSFSSRNFEKKVTVLIEDLQGKLNEKIVDYFFYKNDEL
ncbi:MAG: CvpA family protein, partial [Calditrichaeota bacterium]